MRRFPFAAVAACLWLAAPAVAQDIDDLDEGVVLEKPFVVGIEPGVWELTLQVGYLDLSNVLMRADGIVTDVEGAKDAIFSDMEISGEQSFHPQLRVTRTFGRHFALENSVGFAIGDFLQSASGVGTKWTDPNGDNVLTDLEREKGSYFLWMHDHGLAWYPRGEGRVQPYLVAGAGSQVYFLDSKYVEGSASGFAFSYGAGLRVVGDDLYSLRIEVRNYHTSVRFAPGSVFETRQDLRGESLIDFPVSRLVPGNQLTEAQVRAAAAQLGLDVETARSPETDVDWLQIDPSTGRFRFDDPNVLIPQPYDEYDEESYSNLWISAGFTAAF